MKQQFSIGDKAVYPVHGVAEVVALEQRDIGGHKTPVYILKILDTGMKIMVPKANAGTVGLRDLITPKQVKEVMSILKSRDIPRDTQTWNRRYREYMEKIKTGSVFEIAEVLRDLCVLRLIKGAVVRRAQNARDRARSADQRARTRQGRWRRQDRQPRSTRSFRPQLPSASSARTPSPT